MHYRPEQSAARVRIEIYDGAGRLVAIRQGATGAGSHSLEWNGQGPSGAPLPARLYGVEVVASDAAGQAVPVTTTIRGLVDGVAIDGERLMLSIEGVFVAARLDHLDSPPAGERLIARPPSPQEQRAAPAPALLARKSP